MHIAPRLPRPQMIGAALPILLITVTSSSAYAATVSPGASIQTAIDAATPGETISLTAGTFAQSFTLRSDVAVVGAGAGSSVVTGAISVPAGVSRATLARLTGSALSSSGTGFVLHDAAFTGTVYLEGTGSSDVADTEFKGYLVGRGQAHATLTRVTTQDVAYSWEQSDLLYQDSTLHSLTYLSGSSNTRFLRCQTADNLASEQAHAQLEASVATGLFGSGSSRPSIVDSQVASIGWSQDAFFSVHGSTVSRAVVTVSAGVTADLLDFTPGYLTAASASATGHSFGADLADSTLENLRIEVYGDLTMTGGAFNDYFLVRGNGVAHLDGVYADGIMYVADDGQADFTSSTLHRDLNLTTRGQAVLSASTATDGMVYVQDQAGLELRDGASHRKVQLSGAGSVSIDHSSLASLVLVVSPGLSATIDGLVPGVSTASPVTPGAAGGPALTLAQGRLDSVQLYVQGEADVRNSTVNDYLVVEASGRASLSHVTSSSLAYLRGASITTGSANSLASLYMGDTAALSLTGGSIGGYSRLGDSSALSLDWVRFTAMLEAVNTSSASLRGCTSTANVLRVAGQSRVAISSGSDLYAVKLTDRGAVTTSDSTVGLVGLEVPFGNDAVINGLKPGLIGASIQAATSGPAATLSNTQVRSTELVAYGTVSAIGSEFNGYAFMYPGARTRFVDSSFLKNSVLSLQPGSVNAFTGGRIEGLLDARDSLNAFDGVRFVTNASITFAGTSANTFARCVFEQPLALYGNSRNNFGEIGGASDGDNDFSLIQGTSYKLANFTPNRVPAQNCKWGLETESEIAGIVLDSADNAAYGQVVYLPFQIRNRPPLVDAGQDRFVASADEESLVLAGTAIDPEGDLLTYRWLEGTVVLLDSSPVDPLTGDASLPLSLVPYLEDGEHHLTLEVTEPGGRVTTDRTVLVIANSAPVVSLSGAGAYGLGDAILLGGEASDYDGDTLTYTWLLGGNPLFTGTVTTVAGGQPVALPTHVLANGLPLGSHILTLELEDSVNPTVSTQLILTVVDRVPPVLSPVADPALLWPPDGKMRNVVVTSYAIDAAGGPVRLEARVSSNEAEGGTSGAADWTTPVVNPSTGEISLQLRADRNPHGSGRVYAITVTATDESGNSSDARVEVRVPRLGYEK